MASPLQDLITQIQNLATDIGNALQLRGFKTGGTAGQVPVKTNGTDFNWSWGDAGGATNLSVTRNATTVTVASDTGDDAVIPAADGTNAGLMVPAQFTKLSNLSGTNTGDQDISGKLDISTAASTYAPISHTQAIGTITGLGTNVATSLAIAADATGGIFRQGQALSATTVTASGVVSGTAFAGAPSADLIIQGRTTNAFGPINFGSGAAPSVVIQKLSGTTLSFRDNGTIGWCSTASASATVDTGISRKTGTPGTVLVGNGTANNASGSIELTNLTASGTVTATTSHEGPVGAVVPNTGAFTTVTASGAITIGGGTAIASSGATGAALVASATASAANAILGETIVVKQTTETLTNADFSTPNHASRALVTILANDNELFFTAVANTTYEIDFSIILDWGATDGFKSAFVAPSVAANAPGNGNGYHTGVNPASAMQLIARSGSVFSFTNVTGANSQPRAQTGKVVIMVGASGGTVGFQWAKVTDSANQNAAVRSGSYLKIKRLN